MKKKLTTSQIAFAVAATVAAHAAHASNSNINQSTERKNGTTTETIPMLQLDGDDQFVGGIGSSKKSSGLKKTIATEAPVKSAPAPAPTPTPAPAPVAAPAPMPAPATSSVKVDKKKQNKEPVVTKAADPAPVIEAPAPAPVAKPPVKMAQKPKATPKPKREPILALDEKTNTPVYASSKVVRPTQSENVSAQRDPRMPDLSGMQASRVSVTEAPRPTVARPIPQIPVAQAVPNVATFGQPITTTEIIPLDMISLNPPTELEAETRALPVIPTAPRTIVAGEMVNNQGRAEAIPVSEGRMPLATVPTEDPARTIPVEPVRTGPVLATVPVVPPVSTTVPEAARPRVALATVPEVVVSPVPAPAPVVMIPSPTPPSMGINHVVSQPVPDRSEFTTTAIPSVVAPTTVVHERAKEPARYVAPAQTGNTGIYELPPKQHKVANPKFPGLDQTGEFIEFEPGSSQVSSVVASSLHDLIQSLHADGVKKLVLTGTALRDEDSEGLESSEFAMRRAKNLKSALLRAGFRGAIAIADAKRAKPGTAPRVMFSTVR